MRVLHEADKMYLGWIIDENGWRPDPERTEAIKNMPRPNNVANHHAFLGLANYYSITKSIILELH